MRDLGTEVSNDGWLEAMVAEVPPDALLAAYRAGLTSQEIESSLARRRVTRATRSLSCLAIRGPP